MKLTVDLAALVIERPAAFGRLCVETLETAEEFIRLSQPPSGGCVLKQDGI